MNKTELFFRIFCFGKAFFFSFSSFFSLFFVFFLSGLLFAQPKITKSKTEDTPQEERIEILIFNNLKADFQQDVSAKENVPLDSWLPIVQKKKAKNPNLILLGVGSTLGSKQDRDWIKANTGEDIFKIFMKNLAPFSFSSFGFSWQDSLTLRLLEDPLAFPWVSSNFHPSKHASLKNEQMQKEIKPFFYSTQSGITFLFQTFTSLKANAAVFLENSQSFSSEPFFAFSAGLVFSPLQADFHLLWIDSNFLEQTPNQALQILKAPMEKDALQIMEDFPNFDLALVPSHFLITKEITEKNYFRGKAILSLPKNNDRVLWLKIKKEKISSKISWEFGWLYPDEKRNRVEQKKSVIDSFLNSNLPWQPQRKKGKKEELQACLLEVEKKAMEKMAMEKMNKEQMAPQNQALPKAPKTAWLLPKPQLQTWGFVSPLTNRHLLSWLKPSFDALVLPVSLHFLEKLAKKAQNLTPVYLYTPPSSVKQPEKIWLFTFFSPLDPISAMIIQEPAFQKRIALGNIQNLVSLILKDSIPEGVCSSLFFSSSW